MRRMIVQRAGGVLLGLCLLLSSCGERGDWMKEEAAGTEGLNRAEGNGTVELDRWDSTREHNDT